MIVVTLMPLLSLCAVVMFVISELDRKAEGEPDATAVVPAFRFEEWRQLQD